MHIFKKAGQVGHHARLLNIGMSLRLVGNKLLGSGCGSVGRAVASDTRGPWFESSHGQNLY